MKKMTMIVLSLMGLVVAVPCQAQSTPRPAAHCFQHLVSAYVVAMAGLVPMAPVA